MLTRRASPGFTIIELMVTITIFAILLMLGIPSFSSLLQNHRLSSTAKSYAAGLQIARTKAIRGNTPVEFVLSSTALTGVPAADATAAVPSPAGPNWVVRIPIAGGGYVANESETSESAATSTVRVAGAVAASAPAATTYAGTIVFNGLGSPLDNTGSLTGTGAFELNIDNPAGGACALAGPMRCLRIKVRPGGQIQLCDPAATDPRDSRYCPT